MGWEVSQTGYRGDIKIIEQTVSEALDHWQQLAQQMLELHQQDAEHCSVRIETLINDSHR